MKRKPNIAVVGATGVVGSTFLKVLEERDFPFENIYMMASAKSAGKKLTFKGKEYTVEIAVPTDYYYIYKDLTAGAPSYKTTVQKLSWVKVATGTYTSALFGDITDVELEKCESVEGRYRFKNLFAEGTDIVFNTTGSAQKDDDGKEYYALTVAMQRTGYSDEDGALVVADVSTAVSNTDYLEYNYIYPSTNEIGIYMYYLNLNAAGFVLFLLSLKD